MLQRHQASATGGEHDDSEAVAAERLEKDLEAEQGEHGTNLQLFQQALAEIERKRTEVDEALQRELFTVLDTATRALDCTEPRTETSADDIHLSSDGDAGAARAQVDAQARQIIAEAQQLLAGKAQRLEGEIHSRADPEFAS